MDLTEIKKLAVFHPYQRWDDENGCPNAVRARNEWYDIDVYFFKDKTTGRPNGCMNGMETLEPVLPLDNTGGRTSIKLRDASPMPVRQAGRLHELIDIAEQSIYAINRLLLEGLALSKDEAATAFPGVQKMLDKRAEADREFTPPPMGEIRRLAPFRLKERRMETEDKRVTVAENEWYRLTVTEMGGNLDTCLDVIKYVFPLDMSAGKISIALNLAIPVSLNRVPKLHSWTDIAACTAPEVGRFLYANFPEEALAKSLPMLEKAAD